MNETEKPSYEIARDKLHDLVAALVARGVSVSVSDPFPEVRDDGKWPCIGFKVSFNGAMFHWFVGIGHVSIPPKFEEYERSARRTKLRRCGMTDSDAAFFARGKLNHRDPLENARMAVVLAKYQELKPDVGEVLARVCEESVSADSPFGEWAADYGYNPDSIRAKDIYDECTRNGKLARRLLTKEEFNAFEELACEL